MDNIVEESTATPSKKRRLQLMPTKLAFNLEKAEPLVSLTISNPFAEALCFKVKTNQPRRYCVKPNLELVQPNGRVVVSIQMKADDSRQIFEEFCGTPNPEVDSKDLFLVQTLPILPNFEDALVKTAPNSVERTETLRRMWQEPPKAQLCNTKVKCYFVIPEEPTWLKSSVETIPEDAATSTTNASTLREPVVSVKVPGASSPRTVKVDEGIQASAKKGPSSTEGAYESGKQGQPLETDVSDVQELTDLRQKYTELVNFTVQLTGDRDKIKEHLKEKSLQVQRLEALLKNATEARQSDVIAASNSSTLWQLLLVALVAFLVARLLG